MITVRSLDPGFAVEVSGVSLREDLPADVVAEIKAAIDRSGVAVFRNQPLTDEEQVAFAQLLGVPQAVPTRVRKDNRCTMHRGLAFDETEIRDVRRVTTLDLDSVDVAPPRLVAMT